MTSGPFAPKGRFGRRRFLGGTAALGALAALPRSAFAQDQALSMWTPGGSPLFCDMHQGLIDGWAAANGVQATLQCGIGDGTEYTQVLIGSIAGGTAPDLSIVWDAPIALGIQGAFRPLDDLMANSTIGAETWPAGLLKSCQFGGKTYGLPVTAGLFGMFFNPGMFAAKGMPSDRASMPKTWDEMRAMSKEFTVWNGDTLETAGFMPPRNNVIAIVFAGLNGSKFYDGENQKYTMDAEANIAMFNYFLDWLNEEYRGDINVIDRSGNFNDGYPNDTSGLGPAFQEGRLAGLTSGSWLMGDLYNDPKPVFDRYDIAGLPYGPSGTTSVSGFWPNWMVMPEGSQNPEEAFKYLEYMSVEGVAEWFRVIPDIPTNANAKQVVPEVVVQTQGEAFAVDITAFWAGQAKIVTPMWDSPVEAFGQDQLARAMEKIYTKVSTPAEALAEAQTSSQAELDRFLAG